MTAKKKRRAKVVKVRPHTPKPNVHEVVLEVESPEPPPVVEAGDIPETDFHEWVRGLPTEPHEEPPSKPTAKHGFWNWLFGKY